MSDYGMIGGGLDFGSSFVSGGLPGVGLASSNSFSFGVDAGWGTPGPYVPSTTIIGPYSPQIPAYTNYNDQPAYISPFAELGPAVYISPGGMVSDTVLPYQAPTVSGFLDWAFGGGN